MADRRHGILPPPTSTTIRSEDWDGEDLSGQRHERVAFIDVDMTEVRNDGAEFNECTFQGVKFNVSAHTDAAFLNCTFTRCSFFDATFTNCKLVGSMFDQCTFGILKVAGGDWSFTGLPGSDLRGSSFLGVRMREVDLVTARLERAVLRDCDLSGTWFRGADLEECDLRGSDLSSLDPLGCSFAGAMIDLSQACVIAATLGFDVRGD